MLASPAYPRKPRLSVAMIGRNDAQRVAATIESVRGIADEIVVLDSHSSEETAQAAERLGARQVHCSWCDDLSALRNRCLENISGDWVLWTEPGERLEADSAAALRQFVDRQADSRAAYLLMIEAPPARGSLCGKQAARVRLAPNWSSLRFSGRAAESLFPAIRAAGMSIHLAPGRLVRDSCYAEAGEKARRAQCSLKLITMEAEDARGYSPRLLLALGDAQLDVGNLDDAQHAYLQAVAASPRGSTEMLSAYYGLLGALEGGQRMLQLSTCLDALETFPVDAQLLLAMGNCLQAHQRMDLATRSFDAAFRLGKVNVETWHFIDWRAMAVSCHSLALETQDRMEQAQRLLEEAVTQHPNLPWLRRRLAEVLAKREFNAAA